MPFDEVKSLVKNLADKLEQSNQKNDELEAENTELKNRLRELIGEQKLPEFKEKKDKDKDKDKSKSKDPNPEYKEPKKKGNSRGKRGSKKEKIKIDKKVTLEIDKSNLPKDAKFKGYRKIIIQEIEFKTNNHEFLIPRYYSPSLKKYFEAEVPKGFKGHEFGPELRAFVLMLHHQGRVTENKIHSILTSLGTHISIGHINNITQTIPMNIKEELLKARDTAIDNNEVHVDATGININGDSRYLQCICNDSFSWFDLLENRSRYEVLRGIIGHHKELKFILNESTIKWLQGRIKDEKFYKKINPLISNKIYSKDKLFELIKNLNLKERQTSHLKTGALLTAYRQGLFDVKVSSLISDDAKEYKDVIETHQLCWIHELRHYRMVRITTGFLKEKLDAFFDKAWKFFEKMKEYKNSFNPKVKLEIQNEFRDIFERKWDSTHIDGLRKNTINRKEGLLAFLNEPGLKIHNNPCEFDIREKVVKKKISYGHKSVQGCINGNFWLSLFHTCRKNKIEFWNYLKDRFLGAKIVPQLSDIILQRV